MQDDKVREEQMHRKASGANRMLPEAGCSNPDADAATTATNLHKNNSTAGA